jgi:hypothetical protein
MLVGLAILWFLLGRDPGLGPLETEYHPPETVSPGQAFIILNQCRPDSLSSPVAIARIISATVCNLHATGYIELVIRSGSIERIIRTRKTGASGFEKGFLDALFQTGSEVLLAGFNRKKFIPTIRELILKEAKRAAPSVCTPASYRISLWMDRILAVYNGLGHFLQMITAGLGMTFLFIFFLPLGLVGLMAGVLGLVEKTGLIPRTLHDSIFTLSTLAIVFGNFGLFIYISVTKKRFWLAALYERLALGLMYLLTLFSALLYYALIASFLIGFCKLRADWAIGIILSLFLLTQFRHVIPKWNPESRTLVAKLRGFREFIRRTDADRVRKLSLEDAHAFRRTLAWAVVFGFGRRWRRALHRLGIRETAFFLSRFFENVSLTYSELSDGYFETGNEKQTSESNGG